MSLVKLEGRYKSLKRQGQNSSENYGSIVAQVDGSRIQSKGLRDSMKNFVGVFVMAAAMLVPVSSVQALEITPSTGIPGSQFTGSVNNTPGALAEAATACACVLGTEQYKQNAGGSEEGPLAGSYTTTFNGDVSGGSIVWNGGAYLTGQTFLFVKDGNQSPAWYLFDLDELGWNGQDTSISVVSGRATDRSRTSRSLADSPQCLSPQRSRSLELACSVSRRFAVAWPKTVGPTRRTVVSVIPKP